MTYFGPDILPTMADHKHHFSIVLPYTPISQNDKEWRSRWPRSKYKAAVERDVWALCKAQKIPYLEQVYLIATIYFPDHKRRDLDNYHAPLFKSFQDGLEAAGVISKDDTRYIPELPRLRFDFDKENPRTEITICGIMPSAGETLPELLSGAVANSPANT